jgi:hypothetical protein
MRFLLNEKHIPGEFVGLGWNSEAVLVSDLSSNVSPKLLKQFKNEVEILNSKGAEYVILCGPLNDTEGVTHYVESNGQGYCPTIQELYGIDWSLSNTVKCLCNFLLRAVCSFF